MRAFGADEAAIAAARELLMPRHQADLFAVLPENWHAVKVFDAMGEQWTAVAGMGGLFLLGLRFEALPVVLAALKGTPHRRPLAELLPQLRAMQSAAAPLLNSAR